jgi:diheme cytochrome c
MRPHRIGRHRRLRADLMAVAWLVAALLAEPARPAYAGGRLSLPANETWRTECGACHVLYPPQLLPARSWRAIMNGLASHFGADASLDSKAVAEIMSLLDLHAGRDPGGPAPLRLTDTTWFRRKHREIPPATWARPAIKSPGNCAACHSAAERGGYDDDSVVVPR